MEAACSSSPISSLALPRFRTSAPHRRLFAAGPPPSARLTTSSSSLMMDLDLDLHRRFAPLVLPSHRRRQLRKPVSALLERFNERAVAVVVFSQREARALGDAVVHNSHLLLGLIAEDASADGFLDSGVTIDRAREAVRSWWTESSAAKPAPPSAAATDVSFSAGTKRVLLTAAEYCSSIGCKSIGPELIAISLFKVDDGGAAKVLKSLGADLNQLIMVAFSRLQAKLKSENMQSSTSSYKIEQKPPAGKLARSLEKTKDKSMISQFCVDLTSRAKEGLIDPVIGRDREIQRIIQIICRRTKNNPILLGDAGVGKTAIAEGLALLIASGEVPSFLAAKCILSLDVGLLIAGTKERGELEARVTGLIREVRKPGNIILFIDEVHTLIGSGIAGRGNKSSGLDIANLLKPSLGRGALQCIASTTLEEHKIHFEKDKAFARRFQPVFIAEPSQEDTVRILLGLREKYEMFHKCRFTLEAINAAVKLSARYIPDRHLPDKAIDLIDEAGSRARMDAFKRRKEQQISVLYKSPEEYWQDIRAVHVKHEVESKNKMKYSSDDRISDDFKIVNDEKVPSTFSMNYEQVIVGAEEIAKVASLWSGIPVQKLNEDDRKLLVGLEEELKKRVIGQDDAVTAISQAVKRSRVGLNDPHRPISVMLFCGPTGVGKSELAKALAACYFGSEESMLRLDMSEYMERHTVSKLIGSPPGYLGYGEGGTLTDAVRSKPFSLILLDEIEKAHSDIFNILLQVFEDGQLTDSQGRRVSFKNTLIVMTSNIGSEAISKGKRRIGFFTAEDRQSNSYAAMKALVTEKLKAYFLPELFNRIDEVVFFRSLEKPQMREILNVMLEQVKKRLASLRLSLEVSDAMKDMICQEGFDRIYGARPLRRAVTRLIEDVLSETILARNYMHGDTLVIDVDATGNPFVTRQPDQTIHFLDNKSSPL